MTESFKKLFGTDGIRGEANVWPLTPDAITRLAMAAASTFINGDYMHRVVIGKDTRQSGYMVESALTAGFTSMGFEVILLGPIPTPAVAMLAKSLRADLGVVISASHNPYHDNGIKFFGPSGYKLSRETEKEIERLFHLPFNYPSYEKIAKAKRLDDATGRYVEFAKSTFPKNLRLEGLKIVIDCANGAAYKVAPTALWELGADVLTIANYPNGKNINAKCGATSPDLARKTLLEHNADVAVVLDGDADRLILIDEKGQVIDGDQILALIADHYYNHNLLKGDGLVATHMSNLGLERFLNKKNLKLYRADVGDRYVIEEMIKQKCNIGGEHSGHVIVHDFATTGDGLISALQVLGIMQTLKKPLSEVAHVFDPIPQIFKNLTLKKRINIDDFKYQSLIETAKNTLGKSAHLVVRVSGTEPVIRFMAQGDDPIKLNEVIDTLVNEFEKHTKDA